MTKSSSIAAADENMAVKQTATDQLKWFLPHDKPLQLCGLPFYMANHVFRRLPENSTPPAPNPGVDYLAWHTAGAQIRFRSNSTRVVVQAASRFAELMDHMPQTGICGCDLYVANPGEPLRFFGVSRYGMNELEYQCELFKYQSGNRVMRDFVLNFPLYNGVTSFKVGVDDDAEVLPPAAWSYPGCIVWYGTSIQQGGCANRPGMGMTNIISRKLNCEIVNLAFSGSGKGEAAMADLMNQVPNPGMFILDYEANAQTVENLTATLPVLIDRLRAKHPNLPIVVISRIKFSHDAWPDFPDNTSAEARLEGRKIQADEVARRVENGDKNLFFFDGANLLGEDYYECTVDGIHPTDLGFYRIAEALTPALQVILNRY